MRRAKGCWVDAKLKPGEYALICFDGEGGRGPHYQLGMLKQITVE